MLHPGVRRLKVNDDGFAVMSSQSSRGCHEDVRQLINLIGNASSRAQGLATTITTFNSFSSGENKLYILVNDEKTKVLGFLKVGKRRLFFWDHFGNQKEFYLLALLDFFVYPETQRQGYGKKMIEYMLKEENLEMRQIPIDRPSKLCLSFMKKHYGLSEFMPQANNYVVFNQFWEESTHLPPLSAARTPRSNLNSFRANVMPLIKTPMPVVVPRGRQFARRGGINPITWTPY